MTTADLIAVMNAGKIEQAGSPEDIYDRPALGIRRALHRLQQRDQGQGARRFARRICRRRLALRRRAADGRRAGAGLDPPARHRDFRGAAAQAENVVPATVTRQVFLGDRRDYMVEVKDGTQLRVVTAPARPSPQGSAVWLHLPPERCRALRADEFHGVNKANQSRQRSDAQ